MNLKVTSPFPIDGLNLVLMQSLIVYTKIIEPSLERSTVNVVVDYPSRSLISPSTKLEWEKILGFNSILLGVEALESVDINLYKFTRVDVCDVNPLIANPFTHENLVIQTPVR